MSHTTQQSVIHYHGTDRKQHIYHLSHDLNTISLCEHYRQFQVSADGPSLFKLIRYSVLIRYNIYILKCFYRFCNLVCEFMQFNKHIFGALDAISYVFIRIFLENYPFYSYVFFTALCVLRERILVLQSVCSGI